MKKLSILLLASLFLTEIPISVCDAKTQDSFRQENKPQYGQPGFVGERIIVSVTNVDLRELLDYVTRSYGAKFVLDSSVRGVPVTVRVVDEPWDRELDEILRANKLSAEIHKGIIRIRRQDAKKNVAKVTGM